MSFLPAESRAALGAVEYLLDQEMSKSRTNSGYETQRFRIAKYLDWAKLNHIEEPVGPELGRERLVANFLKSLFLSHNCRANTLYGYAQAINELHKYRNFPKPADMTNKNNECYIVYHNQQREEDVAKQSSPLTTKIFAQLRLMATESHADSAENCTFDWMCIVRISGYRGGEYLQNTQKRIEVHEYNSGRQVIKAFIPTDWVFYDKEGQITSFHSEANLNNLSKFTATHRIQKNRKNGQKISIAADDRCEQICPVRAAYRIYLRAKRLGQTEDQPMGVFTTKQNGPTIYLTKDKVTKIVRQAAKIAHPDWTEEMIKCIKVHSGRVWALVLLSEANKSPWFMKARLRWESDAFRHYLRDTTALNKDHINSIQKDTDEVSLLLRNNMNELPTDVPEDNSMGDYIDQE